MKPGTPPLQSVRLLDQVRERVRHLHYKPEGGKRLSGLDTFFHPLVCHAARRYAAAGGNGVVGVRFQLILFPKCAINSGAVFACIHWLAAIVNTSIRANIVFFTHFNAVVAQN
jgi:hypothetical protein